MSKHKCCVVNCNSISKDVSLHCFPKTEIGLQKWLECIGCENLRGLSELQLRRLRVCHKHFEKRFHGSVRTKSRLRVGAYPTLFSESEIASGNAQTPDKYQTNTGNSDHSYANKRKLHLDDHTYYKKDQKRLCTVIVHYHQQERTNNKELTRLRKKVRHHFNRAMNTKNELDWRESNKIAHRKEKWWNKELTKLRKKVRHHFKRAMNTKSELDWCESNKIAHRKDKWWNKELTKLRKKVRHHINRAHWLCIFTYSKKQWRRH